MMTPTSSVQSVSVDDRCDRCNAAAKLRLTLACGSELVFCGHHANRYADDLLKVMVSYVAEAGFVWRGASLLEAQFSAATEPVPATSVTMIITARADRQATQ